MKIIPGLRRRHYLARVGIFLVAAALIVGMAGCGPTQYNLTISSTEGGEVTTPGEGTFTYDEGTVVDLVAAVEETEEGYRFVEWTGDVDTIANVNAATTTITMHDNYTITANFALGIPVRDWYDLDAVRNNLGDSYILMNDLDSTTAGYEELASPTANAGKGWQPIGTATDPFTGALDGQGHEIRNLYISRLDEGGVGLFGYVYEGGTIKSVGVVNASVTGYIFVGSLVGANAGTVSNSYFTGSVTGTGTGMVGSTVGGLLGWNGGAVNDSHSIGSVSGKEQVGGLVGVNGYGALGTVSNSYSSSNVTGVDDVGGLVGHNGGGENGGTVSNSYSSSNVTGVDDVGGLLGWNGGPVSNSYSTGDVSGNSSVGGLVGYLWGGSVSNSYSTGSVTGNSSVGGLVGANGGTVSDSFWDTETSGQATSAGGTGKNTTEMQDIATFSVAGWNIITVALYQTNPAYIWNIVNNVTYPFLNWQS